MSHCNDCGGARRHQELRIEETKWQVPFDAMIGIVEGGDIYQMLRCRGCSSISFRHLRWCSEWDDQEAHFYPPQTSRNKPAWLEEECIPRSQRELLLEIYEALHNNSPRLAAMGVRSLIERVMIDKVGDNGSFSKNVAAFLLQGWISEKQKETLEKIIDAGHAVTHRDFNPSVGDLGMLMDIVEATIASVYIHPESGARLGGKIPPRRARQ